MGPTVCCSTLTAWIQNMLFGENIISTWSVCVFTICWSQFDLYLPIVWLQFSRLTLLFVFQNIYTLIMCALNTTSYTMCALLVNHTLTCTSILASTCAIICFPTLQPGYSIGYIIEISALCMLSHWCSRTNSCLMLMIVYSLCLTMMLLVHI